MTNTNTTSIRTQFVWAYRAARVERQIKWAPDHVDHDDIDPAKFAPGGAYYNSPSLVAHYKATRVWEDGYKGVRYTLEVERAARKAAATRLIPDIHQQHLTRLAKYKSDLTWDRMWGGLFD
jgi:hypothetical protein